MAAYLQRFVESTAQMPSELPRVLSQIRELDVEHAALDSAARTALTDHIQKAAKQATNTAAQRSRRAPRAAHVSAIQSVKMSEALTEKWRRMQEICELKVALSKQLYDFVDQNICSVDKEMKAFDKELAKSRQQLSLPRGNPVSDRYVTAVDSTNDRQNLKRKRGTRDSAVQGSRDSSPALGLPGADICPEGPAPASEEPTYCYCQRVSFGDMIACDNDSCTIEWFHLACAGLPPGFQPKGNWYCKECTAATQPETS